MSHDTDFLPFVCHTCHMEITEPTMHGWVYIGYDERASKKTKLSPCPTCSDQAMAKRSNGLIDKLLGQSRIPLRMAEWSFTTMPADIDAMAKEWGMAFANRKTEKRALYFHGIPGGGKTGIAVSIIQTVMRRGEDAVFLRAQDLFDRLRESFHRGTADGDDLLALVKSVQWLALDDLATEKATEYVIAGLKSIIEKRMDNELFTVLTGNLQMGKLADYWRPKDIPQGEFHPGLRLVDRLGEYATGVPVKGRNLRQVVPIRGGMRS